MGKNEWEDVTSAFDVHLCVKNVCVYVYCMTFGTAYSTLR